jgi:hypothetical protein
MSYDWWDITVNGKLLVTVNGRKTAEFFYMYLSKDSKYNYKIVYSSKNDPSKAGVKPLSPWDITR